MNKQMKRRLTAVTGIIVIVVVIVLAVVGGNSSATTVSVANAVATGHSDKKIQVTGNVVENSYTVEGDTLTFSIYDPAADPNVQLRVEFDGGVSSTFGNDVTAICTGRVDGNGVLQCSTLVTKCPSKYENATDAIGVDQLLGYGAEIVNKPVKIVGTVKASSIGGVDQAVRFVLEDSDSKTELPIAFAGALPENVTDGTSVVVTGSLTDAGTFDATDVSAEG